jgi:Ca2+-binding EF-hand superfamily protein
MRTTFWAALALAGALAASGLWAAAPPAPRAPSPEADDVQDVAYLGEGRPALWRLHLRADGRAFVARWDAQMTRLFAFLDRDGDGVLDKAEAARAPTPQLLQQMFVGYPYLVYNGTVPFNQLDVDGDGKVTPDEFLRYYRRTTAGPVQLAPFADYTRGSAGSDPVTEALFNALDANKDGKLSKEELQAADKLLLQLDQNDDELISQQELLGASAAPTGRTATRLPPGGRPARTGSLVLVDRNDRRTRLSGRLNVARAVLRRYDKDGNGKLSLSEVGLPEDVFARLDTNKDGELDVLELLRWTGEPPDAELTLRFGKTRRPAAEVGARPEPGRSPAGLFRAVSDTTLSVTLDNTRINVVRSANGLPAYGNFRPYFENQFKALDKDDKGYVTREQVRPQQYVYLRAALGLADRDGDGKLTRQELNAYLDLAANAVGCQLTLAMSATGQGLFQTLDTNGDGQLGVRELRNAWRRLAEFDQEGRGYVTRKQIPRQYQLTVGLGGPGNVPRLPGGAGGVRTGPGTRRGASPRGPLWFRKMDRNGDGDVSRREFLGSGEDFRRIDADGDGLISLEEAERADAWFRARLKKEK